MARLSTWNPYTRPVQDGLKDGQYLNAAFSLIAAGPPRLANVGKLAFTNAEGGGVDDLVYPMGITQSFSLGQNTQIQRFFEIGSERSFFISGHTMGQIQLSRVMYHGPSMMRAMYAYYQDIVPPTFVPSLMGGRSPSALINPNPHNVKIAPGYENLYLNLASDLFRQPVGMMVYLRDSNEDTVGSVYFEASYVPNLNLQVDAQGTVFQESIGIQYERMIPLQVNAIPVETLSDHGSLSL